jgi:hypothetical protein
MGLGSIWIRIEVLGGKFAWAEGAGNEKKMFEKGESFSQACGWMRFKG